MKKYDILYIFVGVTRDDVLNANLEKALAEVTRLEGTVLSSESLGKRTFARAMSKKENGVYVKVRVEMNPAKIEELVKRYQLVEEVFRVQILAVDERREAKLVAEREERQARQARKEAAAQAAAETVAEPATETAAVQA